MSAIPALAILVLFGCQFAADGRAWEAAACALGIGLAMGMLVAAWMIRRAL